MTVINSSSYGWIIVNNVKYEHDIYVLASGRVEEREYGHIFTKEQAEHVLKEKPEVVFIGKGTSGMAGLSSEARRLFKEKTVKVVEDWTPKIKDKFNSEKKRKAAIIHVTC